MQTATIDNKLSRERELKLQLDLVKIRKKKLLLQQQQQEREVQQKQVETLQQKSIRAYVNAYPFYDFIPQGFAILEEGRAFRSNWHISIIAECLTATVTLDIKNLIINIPRRCMKSLQCCVLFPSWAWTFAPELRFLYTSYSAEFAGRDNKKTLDVIDSEWYQQMFGDKFEIRTRKEEKKITNNRKGHRVVFKIGKGTGEGGDYVFADDPNAIDEVESETILKNVQNGWTNISAHNVTDRATARRIIIQQRTDPDDLTGYLTEDEELSKLYKVLCLAMKYDTSNPRANTFDNPLSLGLVSEHEAVNNPNLTEGEEKLWIDPRDYRAPLFENTWYREWYRIHFKEQGLESKGEGQLLWENYLTEEIVAHDIAHLKAHGENAQFQQDPTKRGGNFFNYDNFEEIPLHKMPKTDLTFAMIVDKAGTDGAGDFTVIMLIARTNSRPHIFYIVDMWFKQVSYKKRMEKMEELAKDYFEQYVKPYEESDEPNDFFIIIEKEGNSAGSDVAFLEKEQLGGDFEVKFVNPRVKKAVRAKPAKLISEQGRIKVIKNPAWNGRLEKRVAKFDPNKEKQKDDEIDTMCHGINGLRGANSNGDTRPSNGVI